MSQNQPGQQGQQVGGQTSGEKQVRCFKCKQLGHFKSKCPMRCRDADRQGGQGQGQGRDPPQQQPQQQYQQQGQQAEGQTLGEKQVQCFKCKQLGHFKSKCPMPRRDADRHGGQGQGQGRDPPQQQPQQQYQQQQGQQAEGQTSGEKQVRCFKCKQLGHFRNKCPMPCRDADVQEGQDQGQGKDPPQQQPQQQYQQQQGFRKGDRPQGGQYEHHSQNPQQQQRQQFVQQPQPLQVQPPPQQRMGEPQIKALLEQGPISVSTQAGSSRPVEQTTTPGQTYAIIPRDLGTHGAMVEGGICNMSTSSEQARKEYAEFEEKMKRTVLLDNLSPQVTSAVIETALGQFGTVVNAEFLPNYTIPYPVPLSALVEMETQKQARAVVAEMTNYPFMMSGMPRPVRAQAATAEMFSDRPSLPDRKIQVRWVDPSDPDYEIGMQTKELCKRNNAETLALIKLRLEEEEKLAKQQGEVLKAQYNKYEMIESLMQDSSVPRLARKYGLNLALDEDGQGLD